MTKRLKCLCAILSIFGALFLGSTARADDAWSWNEAQHPAGSGQVPGGSVGGGVYRYHGIYYIPGIGHMDRPLGEWREEQSPTGSGGYGRVSNTTYVEGVGSKSPDIGLVATGTSPLAPIIRVSNAWEQAPITDVGHPGTIVAGQPVCHSGMSAATHAAGGYRCGLITGLCIALCAAFSDTGLAEGGDSGGPVWYYSEGGIVLYGWVRASYSSGKGLYFVPVWTLQNYEWSAAETLVSWGFPAGNDGTGCFVTTKGCIRS